jgi:hypothetical protein
MSGRCRILEMENEHFLIASCNVQKGDRLCCCPEIKDMFLVLRHWDEPLQDGSSTFTIVGRAMEMSEGFGMTTSATYVGSLKGMMVILYCIWLMKTSGC